MAEAAAEPSADGGVPTGDPELPEGGVTIVEPENFSRGEARRRWAELIRLVYEVDPMVCPRWGGQMRVIALIQEPAVIDRILTVSPNSSGFPDSPRGGRPAMIRPCPSSHGIGPGWRRCRPPAGEAPPLLGLRGAGPRPRRRGPAGRRHRHHRRGGAASTTLKVTDLESLWLQIKQMIMPVTVLAFFEAAQLSRYTRSAMLDNLNLDYVRTARAKGLREQTGLLIHVLRNSLIPVVTLIAIGVPTIFAGAIITEQIFRVNGLGQLLITAIEGADIPLVQTLTFVLAVLIVIFNIIADVGYAVLDPRIRYD